MKRMLNGLYKSVSLSIIVLLFLIFTGCGKTDTGISKPVPDCYDNIQNQGELGIDCGGPCNPCPSKVTAKIDGVNWESAGNVTSMISGNSIIILSGNGYSNLSLIYTGPFTVGTYNLQSANYTLTTTQTNYIANSGTISFLAWDNVEKQVTGTFSFQAHEVTGVGDTINVTNGTFLFVPYEP